MRVLLLGATGTIGLATAAALVSAGHEVVCLVRNKPEIKSNWSHEQTQELLAGTLVRFGDINSADSIKKKCIKRRAF